METHSNGKRSYVSVVPAVDAFNINRAVHLRYELLPPHPPFVTSVCLKLANVILLNSGDMLFAILLNDNKVFNYDRTDINTKPSQDIMNCYCRKFMKQKPQSTSDGNVEDSLFQRTNEQDSTGVLNTMEQFPNEAFEDVQQEHCNIDNIDYINKEEVLVGADTFDESEFNHSSKLDLLNNSSIVDNECNSEYVSFVMQGYSLPVDEESQESLPASPFDCTATVMPCRVTSCDARDVLKHTYEHRCFCNNDKGDCFIS